MSSTTWLIIICFVLGGTTLGAEIEFNDGSADQTDSNLTWDGSTLYVLQNSGNATIQAINTNGHSVLMSQATNSSGDASLYLGAGSGEFTLGVDNSDSDIFKISRSSLVGTNTVLEIDGSGDSTFSGDLTVDGSIYGDGSGLTGVLTSESQDMDDVYANGSSTTVDSSDVIFDLTSTYDFLVKDSGTTKFLVTDSGRVGINESNPDRLLHVSGDSIKIERSDDYPGLIFADSGGNSWSIAQNGSSDDLHFYSYDGGAVRMSIRDSGQVGIGITVPTERLEVNGCIKDSVGVLGTCSSDRRLKKDITDNTFKDALEKITNIRPRKFRYREGNQNIYMGVVAQELMDVVPELVSKSENGYYAVNYHGLQWMSYQAISELNLKLGEELEKKNLEINELKSRIRNIEKIVSK